MKYSLMLLLFTIFFFACAFTGNAWLPNEKETPVYTYKIINTFPHDKSAYTQGLVYADGFLYEGTGQNGESSIRKVDLESGNVLQLHELSEDYFGEGIVVYKDRIIQLTWQSKTGFFYDRASFVPIEEFYYTWEGWGLTFDGERLIMSDGTSKIYFLDPETFEELGEIEVKDNGNPVDKLNELEFINGEIFANVWQTDKIVKFSPKDGKVNGWVNLSGLLNGADRHARIDVLNGIAYDAENNRIFVTGKYWPKLFEIEIVPE